MVYHFLVKNNKGEEKELINFLPLKKGGGGAYLRGGTSQRIYSMLIRWMVIYLVNSTTVDYFLTDTSIRRTCL